MDIGLDLVWDLLSPSDILLLQDLMGEDGMHSYNEQAGETCLEQVSGNLNTLNGHHGAKRMSGTYIGFNLKRVNDELINWQVL